jgi:protein transport protein SEC23
LVDTFFGVLVWHGADIAAWRNAGYQQQLEEANLKEVLEAPLEEARTMIGDRFPTPLLVVCDQDLGLSRYLLASCNLSAQNYDAFTGKGEDNWETDEPSLARFAAS